MPTARILMLLTSHSKLGNTGRKTGFWLEELATPYYVFKDAGIDITLASIKGGQPPIDPSSEKPEQQSGSTKRFTSDDPALSALASTPPVNQLDATQYDAIFFPGGHGPMWDFPGNDALSTLIEQFNQQHKIISAVCHGVVALVDAKDEEGKLLVSGKKLTCFSNQEESTVQLTEVVPFLLEDKLIERGAIISNGAPFKANVVVDNRLITGQNPASSGPCAEKVIAALK